MSKTSWADVHDVLDDLDFPASKEEIVRHAEHKDGSSPGAVRMLRALPLATYHNIAEIHRSVPLDPAADEGQTAARQAEQARSHHSRQIAEHLRETE